MVLMHTNNWIKLFRVPVFINYYEYAQQNFNQDFMTKGTTEMPGKGILAFNSMTCFLLLSCLIK